MSIRVVKKKGCFPYKVVGAGKVRSFHTKAKAARRAAKLKKTCGPCKGRRVKGVRRAKRRGAKKAKRRRNPTKIHHGRRYKNKAQRRRAAALRGHNTRRANKRRNRERNLRSGLFSHYID